MNLIMENQFDYEREKQKLEQEKLDLKNFQKEQEYNLERESDILIQFQESLLTNKFFKAKKNYKDENNLSELESIKFLYDNKLKNLSLQLNQLKEEREFFYKYRDDANLLLEKQIKNIDIEIIVHDKKKLEVLKKLINLEEKEKEIINRISQYEEKKNDLTNSYNKVLETDNENKIRTIELNDMLKELDKRKFEIEKLNISLKNKLNETKNEKEIIEKEKLFIEAKKNNLLLKLESIDLKGKEFIEGKNIEEKEKNWQTQKEKFFYETFNGNFMNPLNKSKSVNYFSNKGKDFSKTDDFI